LYLSCLLSFPTRRSSDLEQLYDLPKGILLHSNGVPLGSFMEGYETYIRGLHDNGWRVVDAGVSGHASKEDLLAVAYTINAKVTVDRKSTRLNSSHVSISY